MSKPIYIAVLAALLLALCVLVPSPALMEEAWTPDASQATPIALDAPAGYAPDPEGYKSETLYEDPTIRVSIETTRYCDTPMFVARVQIADASQLRTMMAGSYGSQRTALATTLAERGGAVLAINGDYFSYIGTGLVVRQGHTYRKRADADFDVLMIDVNGDFHVAKKIDEATLDAAYSALGGSVEEGGSGEKAGLQRYDIITAIDGKTVETIDQLSSALKSYRAGDQATLTIYRSGQTMDIAVTFGEKPQTTQSTQEQTVQPSEETPSEQSGGWGFP